MNCFMKKVIRFLAGEGGHTAVEYAVVMMLVFLVCLSAVILLGEATSNSFEDSSKSLEDAFGASGAPSAQPKPIPHAGAPVPVSPCVAKAAATSS